MAPLVWPMDGPCSRQTFDSLLSINLDAFYLFCSLLWADKLLGRISVYKATCRASHYKNSPDCVNRILYRYTQNHYKHSSFVQETRKKTYLCVQIRERIKDVYRLVYKHAVIAREERYFSLHYILFVYLLVGEIL